MASVTTVELPPFQQLLDDHGDAVLRMLVVMVGRQDAGDAWQETYAKAWVAYPRLASASNVRGWLFAIARNVAIDVHRAAGRRAVPTDGAEWIDGALPLFGSAEVNDPARAVAEADLWHRVDGLPPKQRLAVVYRYVGDLTYDQIADVMGCTTDAARRSAYEGIRRLRQEVAR